MCLLQVLWEPSSGPQTERSPHGCWLSILPFQTHIYHCTILTFTPALPTCTPGTWRPSFNFSRRRISRLLHYGGRHVLMLSAGQAGCLPLAGLPRDPFSSLNLAEGSSTDCHLSLALRFESFSFVLIGWQWPVCAMSVFWKTGDISFFLLSLLPFSLSLWNFTF